MYLYLYYRIMLCAERNNIALEVGVTVPWEGNTEVSKASYSVRFCSLKIRKYRKE